MATDLNSQCDFLLPLRLPGTAALCHHMLPRMVNSQGKKLSPTHLGVWSVMHRPSSKSVLLKGLCGVKTNGQRAAWVPGERLSVQT